MAKKILSFLSMFAFLVTAGVCFVACGSKEVTIQGTINIEFDGFTENSLAGGISFSCASIVNNTREDTENGFKYVWGPEKAIAGPEFEVNIYLSRIWDINLVVEEKNGKPFTTRTRDDGDLNSPRNFIITIPFAEKLDYTFVISKPSAQINHVVLNIEDEGILNSNNAATRDFLEHAQVWVDNMEEDDVGGFMPLISDLGGEAKQFGLSGKYIKVDMTKETFALYLKYENEDKDFPFDQEDLRSVFGFSSGKYPNVQVTEFQNTEVYAFEFETEGVKDSDIIYLKSGVNNLKYLETL